MYQMGMQLYAIWIKGRYEVCGRQIQNSHKLDSSTATYINIKHTNKQTNSILFTAYWRGIFKNSVEVLC